MGSRKATDRASQGADADGSVATSGARAPGKRTRTQRLGDGGARPVQRQAAPVATATRPTPAQDWSEVVARPDLYQRPSAENSAAPGAGSGAVVQRKLKLTGDPGNVNRAVQHVNAALFGYTAAVDRQGYVSLTANDMVGPPSPQQQAMYDHLNTIISEPDDVTVQIDASNPDVLGGSYNLSTINMDDIDLFGAEGGMTSQGVLIHELVEQYHKQIHGEEYGGEGSGAHGDAIAAENDVNGSTRGPQSVASYTDNGDGTFDAVVEVPYTFPDGRVVTSVLTIENGDLTKVEHRETTPASE